MPRTTARKHALALTLMLSVLVADPVAGAPAESANGSVATGGTLSLESARHAAGEHATVRLVYSAGDRIIEPGGGLRIDRSPLPGHGAWQTVDPRSDDFLTITSDNPALEFVAERTTPDSTTGDDAGTLVFRLRDGAMQPGDRITLTFGDTRGGSRGARMPETTIDALPLPVSVAFTADDRFEPLAAPTGAVRIDGAPVAVVRGLVPSVVRPAEPFTLSVRAEDRFRNPAATPLPGWRVMLDDNLIAEIPAGSSPLSLLPEIRIRQSGVHVFSIESSDGTIRGVSNPVLVDRAPPERIFWGDMNAHAGPDIGEHSATRFLDWARADARMDFVGLNGDAGLDSLPVGYRSAHFTPFLADSAGAGPLPGLQQSRIRPPDSGAPVRLASVGIAPASSNGDVRGDAEVDTQGHPQDEPLLLEVSSRQGHFEWALQQGLAQGHALAAVGGSSVPPSLDAADPADRNVWSRRRGLTAVMVPFEPVGSPAMDHATADQRARHLFEALRSGRTYATNGVRMILQFSVNGEPVGARIPDAGTRRIQARVIGTGPLDTISLFRNGQVIRERDLLTDPAPGPATDGQYLVSFESASVPGAGQQAPRDWRRWQGRLHVAGATLVSASGYDDQHPLGQRWDMHRQDAAGFEFTTRTRGNTSQLLLTLQDVGPDARVVLELDVPDAPASSAVPPPATGATTTTTLDLALGALRLGRLVQPLPGQGFNDRIEMRRLRTGTVRDETVQWNDRGIGPGDYYYLRATQLDGGTLWSSPIRIADRPSTGIPD